jgi:hypothetical protein
MLPKRPVRFEGQSTPDLAADFPSQFFIFHFRRLPVWENAVSHSCQSLSSRRRFQEDLDPTGTGSDELSRIVGSPTFGEADPDRVRIERSVGGSSVTQPLVGSRLVVVEDLNGITWRNFVDCGWQWR